MSVSPDVTSPSLPATEPGRDPTRRSVLAPPRHPIVVEALTIARRWCDGHEIDGAPAITHAVRVADLLGQHLPDAPPALVAAVLLHDVPDYTGPEQFGAEVSDRCGTDTLIALWLIHGEHIAMEQHRHDPDGAVHRLSQLRPDIAAALAADKVISLTYVLGNARQAPDIRAYWAARRPFLLLVPYLRTFLKATGPQLPDGLADELGGLLREARRALVLAAHVPTIRPHAARPA
ncbi:HD domain-containing protein [Parafrankia elaeagni]|uniref:HD domain-containing protein n=1 Tax=Parafrankia elaeagni TaxID=222534 RepID=UPI00054E601D|nr:HD domain-containing protein [Parafrankia elaeagni]